jgi:hypothetical protein
MPQGSTTTTLQAAAGYLGTQVSLNDLSVRLAAGSSATSGAISMDALRYTLSGTQQGSRLVGTPSAPFQLQGNGVALSADGNTLAVGAVSDSGATGATWIFTRSGSTWTQQGSKLVGTGGVGSQKFQGNGVALSADGNTLAVGGPRDNSNIGATWIFTRSGTTWTQQGSKLVGTGGVGQQTQGRTVSLSADGNTLAVGGDGDNSTLGATWIFTRSGSTWTQQGSKLVGTGNTGNARQGGSVRLSADGNVLASSGYADNPNVGATWIFTRSGSTWTQQGSKLVGTGGAGNQSQGQGVALSRNGNTLAVGGVNNSDGGPLIGATWIFT